MGGKAANLGEMLGHGFPVPAGFVITADACADAIAKLDLTDERRRLRDLPPDLPPAVGVAWRSVRECTVPGGRGSPRSSGWSSSTSRSS